MLPVPGKNNLSPLYPQRDFKDSSVAIETPKMRFEKGDTLQGRSVFPLEKRCYSRREQGIKYWCVVKNVSIPCAFWVRIRGCVAWY